METLQAPGTPPAPPRIAGGCPAPARRGELDVLRALVVVGLVFFHSAVIFGAGEFPVKADDRAPVATVFFAFGATWGMPLLFRDLGDGRLVLAAVTQRDRVRARTAPETGGAAAGRAAHPGAAPGLPGPAPRRRPGPRCRFYARFWDVRPALDFPFVLKAAPRRPVRDGHLWFLVCLLGFSLVLLPGLTLLRRPRGRLVELAAGSLARPGGILLPAVPLVAVEVLLGSEVGHGGWNHGQLRAVPRLRLPRRRRRSGSARRYRRTSAARDGPRRAVVRGRRRRVRHRQRHGDPFSDMDPLAMAFRLLKSRRRLAVGGRHPGPGPRPPRAARNAGHAGIGTGQRRAPPRRHLNDAVLPFYVLHETVVVATPLSS